MSAAAPDLSFSLSPNPSPFSVPSPVCAVSRGRCGLAEAGFVGGLHVGLFTGDLLFAQVLLDHIVHELHPLVLAALMTFRMLVVLPSRMELDSAEFDSRISLQAIRPLPFAVRSRIWAQTPLSESASMDRIWACCADGNTSMIRSTVLTAELVCKVPNTNDPIVAAVTASEMVS